jgi:rubrerythrin
MQPEEIKQEYKKRRTRQLLVAIPLIPIIFIMRHSQRSEEVLFDGISNSTISTIGIIFMVSALVFSLYNWRCPGCKKYLGKGFNPKHCPKCGSELR